MWVRPGCLVVLCHGVGANGQDLIGLARAMGVRRCRTSPSLAPDAPEPCDMAPFGRQWFSLQDRDARGAGGWALRAGVPALADGVRSMRNCVRLGLPEDAYGADGVQPRRDDGAARRVAAPGCGAARQSWRTPAPCSTARRAGDAEMTGNAAPVLLVHGEADDRGRRSHAVPCGGEVSVTGGVVSLCTTSLYRKGVGHWVRSEGGLAGGHREPERVTGTRLKPTCERPVSDWRRE